MSNPIYLNQGRGRGRGRGRQAASTAGGPSAPVVGHSAPPGFGPGHASLTTGPHGVPKSASNGKHKAVTSEEAAPSARLEKAAAMQQQAEAMVSRLKDEGTLSVSSSEDDDDDDETCDDIASSRSTSNQDSILTTTLKLYQEAQNDNAHLSSDGLKVDSTCNLVKEACSKGGKGCQVCLGTIKRTDPVWNCSMCHVMLHLQCAQSWAKEGVFVHSGGVDGGDDPAKSFWACSNCRHEYPRHQQPSFYFCFCGKEQDPVFDRWLTPHSCGEPCGRVLKSNCGHQCMLLCHPGPCPPCPRSVQAKCYCGKSSPTTRRCAASGWACGKPCGRMLACGQHRCNMPCHDGECRPCSKQSVQPCRCGRQSQTRACAEADWACQQVCGRELSCRNHVCEEVCHAGPCGECPRAGERSCPCGKSRSNLPCSEDVPNCGDTCGKLLPCGTHRCARRCHRGDCEQCRQMVTKFCRCGRQSRSIPCFQDVQCESKCTRMRTCTRHPCKRKCCDGNCPPCDKPCGRPLQCRKHKCQAPCHPGACYPCNQQESVTCRCGASVTRVPCGLKRAVRVPKCTKPCQIPPDCHHKVREAHHCHMKDCPRCRQVCALRLPNCSHQCPLQCHNHIREKEEAKSLAPWELAARSAHPVTTRPRPCPPCKVPMLRSCLGKHGDAHQPCSEQRDYSCGVPCGRQLACGNHTCELLCHANSGSPETNLAGHGCMKCEEACTVPRPTGCEHPCPLPCHTGDCPPCKELIRLRCHCGALPLVIKCPDYAAASTADARDALCCCSDQCPKTLACGHRCRHTCHSGECSSVSGCPSKVTKRCPCKRQSVKFKCCEAAAKVVECDDTCQQLKTEKRKLEEAEKRRQQEEEDEKNKAEVARLERQLRGKTRKHRARPQEEVEASWLQRHRVPLTLAVLFIIALALLVYIFKKASGMQA